jgi:hypothetical protein
MYELCDRGKLSSHRWYRTKTSGAQQQSDRSNPLSATSNEVASSLHGRLRSVCTRRLKGRFDPKQVVRQKSLDSTQSILSSGPLCSHASDVTERTHRYVERKCRSPF